MTNQPPLLGFDRISKRFEDNEVLTDVSFSLKAGEILGLVGENGAGKSTLMNLLFGAAVIQETGGYQGRILIDGEETRFRTPAEALAAGIGMVHQEFSLIPGFTAGENILLNSEPTRASWISMVAGPSLRTLDRQAMQARALKALIKLGIELDPDLAVSSMPVGFKQFTEIARELARENVRLLVLDEPTAVLTESESAVLLRAMKKLAADGIAIILISHRLQEIVKLTDRVVVLRDGRVVAETPTAKTSIAQLAEWMVGRQVSECRELREYARHREPPILTVEHLRVAMPGETVHDVSFQVNKGEMFGLGGLAGQGKLGIPNGLMGLYPAWGNLTIDGKAVTLGLPERLLRLGVGFVSEDRRGVGLLLDERLDLNIGFTAMQMKQKYLRKLLAGLLTQRDDKALAQEARRYITMLEIKCLDHRQKARELSGGNQQKLCLAKAFALDPKILFVSEPTRGIDVGAKETVLNFLLRSNTEQGVTIIMVSSELEELRRLCDRVAIVTEGRIAGILPGSARPTEFALLMTERLT